MVRSTPPALVACLACAAASAAPPAAAAAALAFTVSPPPPPPRQIRPPDSVSRDPPRRRRGGGSSLTARGGSALLAVRPPTASPRGGGGDASDADADPDPDSDPDPPKGAGGGGRRQRLKSRIRTLATRARRAAATTSSRPAAAAAAAMADRAAPAPQAIAAVLRDATGAAVDEVLAPAVGAAAGAAGELALEAERRIRRGRAFSSSSSSSSSSSGIPRFGADTAPLEAAAAMEGEAASAIDSVALAKTTAADAFAAAELAVSEAEAALKAARAALDQAKAEAAEAIAAAEEAAASARMCAVRAEGLALASAAAGGGATAPSSATAGGVVGAGTAETAAVEATAAAVASPAAEPSSVDARVAGMTYDDVDYHLSEMAPPFLGEDQCLVPGEAVVRVERAPENSRRIFAGIDILASVDDVWKVLTDYEHLQDVVPNLVVNEVLETYESDSGAPSNSYDPSLPDEEQCESMSRHMRGAKLRQVGGAKVVGINFSARTTLEVREWPEGMPDFAHYSDEVYEGKSRTKRAREGKGLRLRRYRFPRPFALSSLPTKDISMQSVEGDDGEFRMYQGVWRMQPLPGCAPPGGHAMRLTYAVEISPRPFLPVALVEGRIAQDLCTNLRAIRDHVTPAEVLAPVGA